MEEKYTELFVKTDYDALTVDEKEILKELCTNQSEFEEVKQLMKELNALDAEPEFFDSRKIKKRLDEEFIEVNSSKLGGGWINFLFPPLKPIMNRPGIQFALVLVLFLGSYLVLELMDFNNTKTVRMAKNENKISNKNEEVSKESEIDDDLMFDEKNLSKNRLNDSELTSELVLIPEVNTPLESQEVALMKVPLISEESDRDNSINQDLKAPDFEPSRADFEDEARMSNDNDIEMDKFLIPTVQERPEILEGLFVTF